MRQTNNKIIYTADDEEPNCLTCDYAGKCTCGEDTDNPTKCGPKYGWSRYYRTEKKETV